MAYNFSPKIVTDGLVLYLDAANTRSYVSGSTTWTDISRGGNNGTLTNGPTFNSANGGSIVFDGLNNFVTGNKSTVNANNGMSIIMWVKTTSTSPQVIFSHDSVVLNNGFRIGVSSGVFDFTLGGVAGYSSGVSISNGSWKNLIFTSVGTNGNFYVNGVMVNSVTIGTMSGSPDKFIIGRLGFASLYYFNGSIASTMLYNRALSTTEILQNYNATKTRFGL